MSTVSKKAAATAVSTKPAKTETKQALSKPKKKRIFRVSTLHH